MKKRICARAMLSAVVALLLTACGASVPGNNMGTVKGFPKNADGYADISVDELAELMENEDFSLVNVHIPYEGEIPRTDLFIPYNKIADHLSELPAKDEPIVLYCRSGSMSTTAAQVLVDEGYTKLMELDGGFSAWRVQGYELLQERQ
jgi:rhodanese-related sulfurtransferase